LPSALVVLGEVTLLVGVGLVAGLGAARATAAVLLGAVALLAGYLPAQRFALGSQGGVTRGMRIFLRAFDPKNGR
jgi:hypothetical protein